MSLLQWFSKKPSEPSQAVPVPESSGLGHVDATVPLNASLRGRSGADSGQHGANRKTERLERRELLYAVIRQSMTRAGVLSASYKFKVLSLDSSSHEYLVMLDIAREHVGDTTRLTEIESEIAKSAKTRHDILVTAVYWRVNEHVTAGLSPPAAEAVATVPSPVPRTEVPAADVPAAVASPSVQASKSQPASLLADEMAAFKQAVAAGTPRTPKLSPSEAVKPARRTPEPQQDFQDTQLDDSHTP